MKNRVVEAAVMTGKAPMLIDVDVLGLLYLGNVRVDADPFTIFKRNLTTLRVETTALYHVRNIQGAYRVSGVS